MEIDSLEMEIIEIGDSDIEEVEEQQCSWLDYH